MNFIQFLVKNKVNEFIRPELLNMDNINRIAKDQDLDKDEEGCIIYFNNGEVIKVTRGYSDVFKNIEEKENNNLRVWCGNDIDDPVFVHNSGG